MPRADGAAAADASMPQGCLLVQTVAPSTVQTIWNSGAQKRLGDAADCWRTGTAVDDCEAIVQTCVVQNGAKMIWQIVVMIPGSHSKLGVAVCAVVDVAWVTALVGAATVWACPATVAVDAAMASERIDAMSNRRGMARLLTFPGD